MSAEHAAALARVAVSQTASPQETTLDSGRIHCRRCDAWYLAAGTRTESTHRSAEGLVSYVRCAAGHVFVHQFAEAYPKPKPPASVRALRTRPTEAHRQ